MPYLKRSYVRRMPGRRPLMGLGTDDSTQCSQIPMGDPYRKPGNYCATPDGGITTFNADGTTYRAPGYAVDPDPAHPVGASGGPGGSGAGGILDSVLRMFAPTPTAVMPAPGPGGMSTTTIVALAGGLVLVAYLVSRR